MTPIEIIALVTGICSAIVSFLVSVFLAGARISSMKSDIRYIRRDIDEIRSLFALTLIGGPDKKTGGP